MIRAFKNGDIEQLLTIYNYYVINTTVTFDVEPVSLKVFSEKINRISTDFPILVYEEDNVVLGFAYGSKWRPKPAYRFTAESTVYVRQDVHGKRIGSQLYSQLFKLLKRQGFKNVMGCLLYTSPSPRDA